MRQTTSTRPHSIHNQTNRERISPIEHLTSLDHPALFALGLFFTLIILDYHQVIGPASTVFSHTGESPDRVYQESLVSLERTRSGGISFRSRKLPTHTPMVVRSRLSERYAERPHTLSAHITLTHPLRSDSTEPQVCEALMIHARVAITHGACAINFAQLNDKNGSGESASPLSVIVSHVNQDRSLALHLLSKPLPFIPVQVDARAHASSYDSMILNEGLARYGSFGDAILISPSAHYAQYGSFIVRKSAKTFNRLSAVIGESDQVLDRPTREWISHALRELTLES